MKPVFRGLGLFLVSCMLILASCQKEDQTIKTSSGKSLTSRTMNCNSDCLEDGEESDPTEYSEEYQPGLWVTVSVSNTNTHVIYTFNSNTTVKNIVFNGTSLFCFTGSSSATLPYVYSVPIGSLGACDIATASIVVRRQSCSSNGAGAKVTFSTSHTIIGACPDCEDELVIEELSSTTYKFTYFSSENLTGANVRFTCPHILGWTSNPTLRRVNPGGGPTVLEWIGNLEACVPMMWTITFDPDCTQNNADFANLWTDFKVNGTSKKGANGNIVYDCE